MRVPQILVTEKPWQFGDLGMNPAYLKCRIRTTSVIRHLIFIVTMNIGRHMTDVVHSVNPTFQVRWVHSERSRAISEKQNEQHFNLAAREDVPLGNKCSVSEHIVLVS